MAHPSKIKGSGFERELVNQARESLGLTPDVDLVIAGFKVQAKRRKRIADYLVPTGGADIQIIRGDRQPAFAVLPFTEFLELIKRVSR